MNDDQARKWLEKAGHDLKIGKDEMATDDPVRDMVCFHMQQCAEKSLKAFLVSKGAEISRTHNLAVILQQCIEKDDAFTSLRDMQVDRLTDYAVSMRYPDDDAVPDAAETAEAIRMAETVMAFVRDRVTAV